jgi:hypothetical protein
MAKKTVPVRTPSNGNMPESSRQLETLGSLLNSVIINLQGQTDVNSALTQRVLALEAKVARVGGGTQNSKRASAGK